jgi:putative hemolysin
MNQKINTWLGVSVLVIVATTAMAFVYLIDKGKGPWDETGSQLVKSEKKASEVEEVGSKLQIANPASVYCEKNGGTLKIKTASDGGQTGYCTLKSGEECEEWSYLRGECPVGKSIEKQIVYIQSIYEKNKKTYLDVDYIQWFSGDEAAQEAFRDGDCAKPEYCAPNGFYIRNTNPKLRTFEIDENASISRTTAFEDNESGIKDLSLDEFSSYFSPGSKRPQDSGIRNIPFWISIKNNVIIKVAEQYIP